MGKRRQRGAQQESESAPRRLEIDLIRFEATRLPSGLFRHDPVKYVFQLSRYNRDQTEPASN
jgi:hypothetical protein